jgi:hypothetical protein
MRLNIYFFQFLPKGFFPYKIILSYYNNGRLLKQF